jgi:Cd2+/Zn2+-exporting ATPase
MPSAQLPLQFRIHGLDCAEEVTALRREVGPVVGGEDCLAFDILNAKMTVHLGRKDADPEAVLLAVARTGMRAELWQDSRLAETGAGRWEAQGRTLLTAASGLLGLAGVVTHAWLAEDFRAALGAEGLPGVGGVPLAAKILYALGIVAAYWNILPKAWRAVRRFRPDMNLLMTVAVMGAMAIGEWFEAATVAFLFALSLSLESWSVGRARRAVAALLSMAPPQARIADAEGNEQLVGVEEVSAGSRIIIKPGERVPLDGRIVAGQTTVNQAPITGESMPVAKSPGDEVFAGTINQDGAIEVTTVKAAAESMISQVIKLVREAQSRRSPSEQWVEKFAHYYTPSVMLLAIAVAAVPPLLGGGWAEWFYQALVLLVIACPCALVISTPVSIVAALVAAARNGVLIKGGVYVELPGRLKALALDKTGTLTEGRPEVTRLAPLHGHDEQHLLRIAAAIELRSEHPLAQAIVRHAAERGIRPTPVENYQAVKGKGATAVLDGQAVWIGSHRYLEERGQEDAAMHRLLEDLSAEGASVVVVGESDHVCGFVCLADRLRPEARQAVDELHAAGIQHVIMLTGDNRPTAQAIAQQSGVDEFRAELLPQDKVTVVEELLGRYGIVGMVGDGVNDAPALARSSLGIAMGAMGTAAAMETADIALMVDDLSRLPWLVRYSRRVLRIIRQNIVASLAVKAVFVLLTFFGYASLWAAIAADTGMSVLVVFNALRLLRDRQMMGNVKDSFKSEREVTEK